MQNFKHRRGRKSEAPLRRRFTLGPRNKKSKLPKGFRPLPAPGTGPRRTALRLPHFRLRLPPLRVAYLLVLAWLVAGALVNGRVLLSGSLEKVRVSGAAKLTAAQVSDGAGLVSGAAMSALDPFRMAQELARQPHIASVDVRRVYPGALWIDVSERVPVLRVLTERHWALVDAGGVVIETGEAESGPPDVPLVLGVRAVAAAGQVLTDAAYLRARDFLAAARRAGLPPGEFPVVDASNFFTLAVQTSDSRSALFTVDNSAAQLKVYRALAGLDRRAWPDWRTQDLRLVRDGEAAQVVLRP
jgi:hypothetical protein